ncbi:MAG: hypothetical protein FJ109_19965 [Deltaproteobacteria bacterium]|nr:hypothetical protein [Deltaproteobacteria bacterium]
MHQPWKVCPQCQEPAQLQACVCLRCGHVYRTRFAPPLGQTQVVLPPPVDKTQMLASRGAAALPPTHAAPTGAFPSAPSSYVPQTQAGAALQLQELARQYREANRSYMWTLIGGLLLLWPLWVITYMEHGKMRTIKGQVALLGLEPDAWVRSIR